MRPVDRGASPQLFSDYADAKPFLVARMGDFCSYCERPIKTNLAVEHVLPKSLHPELELEWSNFLLGCVNCNSTKLNKPVDRDELLLPDQDNTFAAYRYNVSGQVFPDATLDESLGEKADATLALVGLNKFPDEFPTDQQFEAALERWQQRSSAWDTALQVHQVLMANDNPDVRGLVVTVAVATGFFSVWMAVFVDDSAMRRSFIDAFPGTASTCFDASGNPMPRPNGHL